MVKAVLGEERKEGGGVERWEERGRKLCGGGKDGDVEGSGGDCVGRMLRRGREEVEDGVEEERGREKKRGGHYHYWRRTVKGDDAKMSIRKTIKSFRCVGDDTKGRKNEREEKKREEEERLLSLLEEDSEG